MRRDRLFIGGEWVAPLSTDVFTTISPTSEEPIGVSPHAGPADVDRAVAAARTAFDDGPWPRMAPAERAAIMARLVERLGERAEELAELITDEMGSTLGLLARGAGGLRRQDARLLPRAWPAGTRFEHVRSDGGALVVEEPVGVVAAIVPWNFPQMITMMKLGPALAAGCTVVLKPAPQTALDSYILAEACLDAGLPAGVVNIVPAGAEAGEHLVTRPDVDKVSFTGSTAAGRRIATLCGQDIRRVTLELGGKSAAIVLEDADVGAAVAAARMSAFANAGQACVAQTRFVVHQARYHDVVEGLAELAASLAVGDPRDPGTDVGPLATDQQRARVESLCLLGARGRRPRRGRRRAARRRGARVVRRAHGPRGRPQRHARRPRGDLRPGGLRHPGGQRRGGARRRQRLGVRARRIGVDGRRGPRPGRGAGRAHGAVLDQRRGPRRGRALRRLQAKWLRARMGAGGAAGIPRDQGDRRACRLPLERAKFT